MSSDREGSAAADRERQAPSQAARKRAAVETYGRHKAILRRTASRYSICADDAEEALQRTLEIVLRKAPSDDPRELVRWTQTVVKHEALAVRKERERILSGPAAAPPEPGREDWVTLIPAETAGPSERAERRETIARSREALQALKPQELRALTLLAEGYTYVEIGEMTGFSRTKINRSLAEGRDRFRRIVARSEDGRRCAEMGPLLSAFCDGEAGSEEEATVREHLRACPHCRATLRAYRAAPGAVAALAPLLPLHRPLLERAHDALAGLASRFAGAGSGGGDAALQGIAVGGGTRGAGLAALAKLAAVCAGTVGGAAACVATGVVPAVSPPLGFGDEAAVERPAEPRSPGEASGAEAAVEYEPAPPPVLPQPAEPSRHEPAPAAAVEAAPPPPPASASGAVEYAPAPVAAPAPAAADPGGGDPTGEFGP